MSAEKEIVNFWLNRKGFFTINNIKSRNKDIGILALKYEDNDLKNAMHVEVCCSITGFVDHNNIFEKIIFEKFNDKNIENAIGNYIKNTDKGMKVEKFFVINSLPKNSKVAEKFNNNNISFI